MGILGYFGCSGGIFGRCFTVFDGSFEYFGFFFWGGVFFFNKKRMSKKMTTYIQKAKQFADSPFQAKKICGKSA